MTTAMTDGRDKLDYTQIVHAFIRTPRDDLQDKSSRIVTQKIAGGANNEGRTRGREAIGRTIRGPTTRTGYTAEAQKWDNRLSQVTGGQAVVHLHKDYTRHCINHWGQDLGGSVFIGERQVSR